MNPRRPTFLYDSDCGPCTRLKELASFFDATHAVDFASIDEGARRGLLDSVPTALRSASSRFVAPDGTLAGGGDAMISLIAHLPGGRLPSEILSRAPFGTRAVAWVYGVASRLHAASCAPGAGHRARSDNLSVAWSP